MLEKDLERQVVAFCNRAGVLTYKFTCPGQRGVPDRIIIGSKGVLFLELKRPSSGAKPTALQQRHIKRINMRNGVTAQATWTSSLDEAVSLIKGIL